MSFDANPNTIRLRKIIKHQGLTKPGSKIVSITGQNKSNVSSFINGKKPTPDTVIEKLYEHFNLTEEVIQKVVLDENDTIEYSVEEEQQNSVEEKREIVHHNSEVVKSRSGKTFDKNAGMLVPFYDIDFSAGNDHITMDSAISKPDYYMDVPEFAGCTAFRAYSDSMERLIKSGSILFGTKVEEWMLHLEYGQIYGIICNDGRRYLKYIRRHLENHKECFLLKSENENYDDFDIPKKAIRSVWLIHGWLIKRT